MQNTDRQLCVMLGYSGIGCISYRVMIGMQIEDCVLYRVFAGYAGIGKCRLISCNKGYEEIMFLAKNVVH